MAQMQIIENLILEEIGTLLLYTHTFTTIVLQSEILGSQKSQMEITDSKELVLFIQCRISLNECSCI